MDYKALWRKFQKNRKKLIDLRNMNNTLINLWFFISGLIFLINVKKKKKKKSQNAAVKAA